MKNNLPKIPDNIIKSIDYSPQSIVSKIIFNNDKLQITLFAVDKSESFEKHTTAKEAIVQILEGEGKFYLKDKWHPFKKGDYFYMPSGLIHAIKPETDFKFLLYQF